MFRIQVISTFRKPICSYVRIHHKRELYRSSLRNIQLYSRALYCSYSKNPCVSPDTTDYDKLEVDTDDANIQQFETEHPHGRRNKTSITSKIAKERLNKLFENPLGNLQSIYKIVNNEFDKKDHITYKYEKIHNMSTTMFKCTIDVSWPEEASFSHLGPNKKAAVAHASKKCLIWLYSNGHLRHSKPILYNQEEVEDILFEPNRINLESKFEDDVKDILGTYSNDIEPIIKESSDIIDNENNLPDITYMPRKSHEKNDIRSGNLYRKLQQRSRSAQNLPILEYKSQILKSINENQILLIRGETGCGKSTQVPQFIMDAYTEASRGHECNILVSEPRKVSAVSLANRVARERGEVVGEVVGFHVRLNHMLPPTNGSILFCTTGIILRRLQSNPTLEGVSHIIIDEAHERTLQIDILLNLMKKLLTTKPDLKLIIMSATVSTELFQQYFSCTAIEVPGKMYPVKMHFMEDIVSETGITCEKSYQDWEIPTHELLQLIKWIDVTKPPGSILCFVPGWREIQHLQNMLEKKRNNLLVLPFHSKLTNAEQDKVFCEVPAHVRKIILATDIAESSITIPDVKYVVDTARKRDLIWNEDSSLYTVFTHWVSQANILQRKGRAGRVSPGESYHMVTKSMYDELDSFPEPEIRRISLDQAVVTSKTFSNETAEDFFNSMIDHPSKKSLSRAVEYLKSHNVLDENEKLTPLGKRMMYFSLDVKLSKALLLSCVFHCLNPMLTITTMLSTDNESSATSLIGKADKKHQKSEHHDSSDHIGMSEMFKSMNQYYNEMSHRINYRSSHYKNYNKISLTRELYLTELIQTDMVTSVEDCQLVNIHSKQLELIRAVLFAATNQLIRISYGGYKNGYFTKTTNSIKAEDFGNVFISPESVNSKRTIWPSPFLTYVSRVEHVESRRCLVTDTSLISPLSVLLFSHGDITCSKMTKNDVDGNDNVLIAIENLRNVRLTSDERSAKLLLKLRSILWDVVNYAIKYQNVESESGNLKDVMLFKHRLLNLILNIINESANSIDNSAEEASSKRLTEPNSYAQ